MGEGNGVVRDGGDLTALTPLTSGFVGLPLSEVSRAPLLKPREAAALLRTKWQNLAGWRARGSGPRYIKMGGAKQSHIRYRIEDLEAWMAMRAAEALERSAVRWARKEKVHAGKTGGRHVGGRNRGAVAGVEERQRPFPWALGSGDGDAGSGGAGAGERRGTGTENNPGNGSGEGRGEDGTTRIIAQTACPSCGGVLTFEARDDARDNRLQRFGDRIVCDSCRFSVPSRLWSQLVADHELAEQARLWVMACSAASRASAALSRFLGVPAADLNRLDVASR